MRNNFLTTTDYNVTLTSHACYLDFYNIEYASCRIGIIIYLYIAPPDSDACANQISTYYKGIFPKSTSSIPMCGYINLTMFVIMNLDHGLVVLCS